MSDDIETPRRGYNTEDVQTQREAAARQPKRRHWARNLLLAIILIPTLGFAAWTWATLNFSYSNGERAGYIQKISQKGWLCKTWEGELAMANLPGAMPEIFRFTVRDDSVAHAIDRLAGQRVSLTYSEHRGVPTSCFGETGHYVTRVRPIDAPQYQSAPAAPPGSTAPAAPGAPTVVAPAPRPAPSTTPTAGPTP